MITLLVHEALGRVRDRHRILQDRSALTERQAGRGGERRRTDRSHGEATHQAEDHTQEDELPMDEEDTSNGVIEIHGLLPSPSNRVGCLPTRPPPGKLSRRPARYTGSVT